MSVLDSFLNFIKYNPPYEEHWYEEDWEFNFNQKFSQWLNIITDPNNWHRIDRTFPRNSYQELCYLFCRVINNYKFIIRWFYSDISYQSIAAKNWLKNIYNITIEAWKNFTDDIKLFVITYLFDSIIKNNISLISKTINEYQNFFYDLRNSDETSLEQKNVINTNIMKLTELTVNIYQQQMSNSIEFNYLNHILTENNDQKYLKIFNDMLSLVKQTYLQRIR